MDKEAKIDLVEKLLRYHFDKHNATLMMSWSGVASHILAMIEAFDKTELTEGDLDICSNIPKPLLGEK